MPSAAHSRYAVEPSLPATPVAGVDLLDYQHWLLSAEEPSGPARMVSWISCLAGPVALVATIAGLFAILP